MVLTYHYSYYYKITSSFYVYILKLQRNQLSLYSFLVIQYHNDHVFEFSLVFKFLYFIMIINNVVFTIVLQNHIPVLIRLKFAQPS